MTGRGAGRLFLLVFLLALVEFGQVWFFPGSGGSEAVRRFGGAFRLALWLGAAGVIAAHLARRGPGPMAAALAPYAGFVAWGAVAVLLWSVDRVTGLRALVFWALAAGAAVAAGREVEPRRLARGVALLFGGVALASLALALVRPGDAHTVYGEEVLVRGFFPHKNQLGWFCTVGLLWVLALWREIGPRLSATVLGLLAVAQVAAGSITAQAILVAAAGFAVGLRAAARLWPDGGRAALAVAVGLVLAATATVLLLPALLEPLGRDATFTGRTDVWRHYLGYIDGHGLTGFGTGIFSTVSQMNLDIGGSVPGYEGAQLRSPHNTYLGIVGETGVIGVAAFLLGHLYVVVVAPFRSLSPWPRLAATLAFAILLAGLAEMRDGYSPGVATVALLAARACGLGAGEQAPRRKPAAQAL